MALTQYSYHIDPEHIVGCPLLVVAPPAAVTVNNTTPAVVFGGITGTSLTVAPNNFNSRYPLLLKIFCSGVSVNIGPSFEFVVTVSCPNYFADFSVHRVNIQGLSDQGIKDFGITRSITGWNQSAVLNVTVSVLPIAPLTTVSFSCLAGLALDTIDAPYEAV